MGGSTTVAMTHCRYLHCSTTDTPESKSGSEENAWQHVQVQHTCTLTGTRKVVHNGTNTLVRGVFPLWRAPRRGPDMASRCRICQQLPFAFMLNRRAGRKCVNLDLTISSQRDALL